MWRVAGVGILSSQIFSALGGCVRASVDTMRSRVDMTCARFRSWDIELVLSEPLIFSKFQIIIALLTQTSI